VLVDPDRASPESAAALALECAEAAVDAFLLGSSTPLTRDATPVVRALRRGAPSIPILLFPGGADQLHDGVDAVLFLSLLSGRDARFLIGEQLRAAPRVLASGIEPIATAYLLVGDAEGSSVARVTGTAPLPIEPAAGVIAHAQAAACLGMSLVYLEGGSGAKSPLPASFVRAVAAASPLPIAVGGGVRRPNEAAALAAAGARFIVTGTAHEQGLAVRPFTEAVHGAAVTV
jgi:phosphoglycerol geranylgeranyltransferase